MVEIKNTLDGNNSRLHTVEKIEVYLKTALETT